MIQTMNMRAEAEDRSASATPGPCLPICAPERVGKRVAAIAQAVDAGAWGGT
jgi:hypothetical protein